MKKPLFYALALALVFGVTLLMAAEINVTGDWDMTTTSQRGPMTRTISFTQTGENLTVKMPGPNNTEMTGTGTIKGDELEWTITRTGGPQGEMKFVYKAKVDGDKMTGTVQFGDRPAREWTAVRKAK